MSQFIDVIKKFDGSGDLLEAQREVIETLEQLAIAKADVFSSEIDLLLHGAGGNVDKTVPIIIINSKEYSARAFSSTSTGDIAKVVADAIQAFLGGVVSDVLEGVKKLLSKALEVFFGSSSAASSTMRQYFVYATPFCIYRVDMAAWYRMVTASAIQTKINKAVAVAYTQSTVDIENLTWAEFIGIYGLQLQELELTPEKIVKARQDMKDAWNFMKEEKGLEQDAIL
jgi:hypothetical protein